jgi:hypothetical protein
MTDWKQIDKWYLKLDDWTISKMKLKNGSKYALWQGNLNKGFFETADEAKAKYEELNK